MNEAANKTPGRRRSDDLSSDTRRVGVIWSGDATAGRYRLSGIILDISPDGARLRTDTILFGRIETFRLSVERLPPIDCAPVWQKDGSLGVRFLAGQPTASQINALIQPPSFHV